jgi:hypothetical protein
VVSPHQPPRDGVARSSSANGSATGGLPTVDACTLAAARATSKLAHAEAAGHLERAIDLLVGAGQAETATHFELVHTLGRAHWRAGQRDDAAAAFDEAWRLAERLDDVEARARAAIGGGFSCDFSGPAAIARAERCRTSLAHLPDGDGALRARLLADLAASLAVQDDRRPGQIAAAEALAMARRVGDPVAIGYALVAVQFLNQGPSRLAARLSDAREIISIATGTGEHPLQVLGRFCLIGALLESGDASLDREISAQTDAVRRLGEPGYQRHDVWFQCMRALLRGSVDDAERLAARGLEVASAAGDPDAFAVYGGQFTVALWMRGRPGEAEDTYLSMRRAQPNDPLWTAVLAGMYATTGRPGLAAELVPELPIDIVPDDQFTLLTLATLAEAAWVVGDDRVVGDLYDVLTPFADRMIPIAMGVSCWGPVARTLGMLSVRLGAIDRGIDHLTEAIDLAGRLSARPWLAEAELDLVATQLQHGRVTERTRVLLEQAAALADSIGMPVLQARAAELYAQLR